MKIIRLLVIACCFLPAVSSAQTGFYFYGIFRNYFPYSPFESTFSDFFKSLNSDPQFANKKIQKRTDSLLFSFYCTANAYDRGTLRATDVEIKLNEIVIPLNDSLNKQDTFVQYQVIYNYNNSNAGPRYVKKIFTDFGREYNGQFSSVNDFDIKDDGKVIGLTRNYFVRFSPVSPMTAAWANISDTESIFTIMVRLKLVENELVVYNPAEKKGNK